MLNPDARRRLEALVSEAGLSSPDVMIHDLGRAELRAVWEKDEAVIVVEIGDSADPVGANADHPS